METVGEERLPIVWVGGGGTKDSTVLRLRVGAGLS